MNLLIVSHTPHYEHGSAVRGWGATVREIDHLATLFERVTHIAPLYALPPPPNALNYESSHVRLRPVPPSGGARLADKVGILARSPRYARAILNELPHADVVHVRCPANISLIAVLLLPLVRHPRLRWIKYAGNWKPERSEPLSYTLQRWWLNTCLHRAQVTVNGRWPGQPAHVHSFLNPCLTGDEIERGEQLAAGKTLTNPLRLIYVGQINRAKGAHRALETMALLQKDSCDAHLDIIGDGDERPKFESQAHELGIRERVTFHGWLPRGALDEYYAQAHLMLLPTDSSEGWPKVLSEAMAFGVVPLAGKISSIPQYLHEFKTGRAINPYDVAGFAGAILWYTQRPEQWKLESYHAVLGARQFSYSNYLDCVRGLLGL